MAVFELLKERRYIRRTSDDTALRNMLDGSITFYQGFDPTADSLHVGHLMSLMAMHHLQEAGHRPIFILGGGTGIVGDPSGRSEGRRHMTRDQIARNGDAIRKQVESIGLVRFQGNAAVLLDNSEWLDMPLFEYLINVTVHFSVNRMVKQRTFANRLNRHQNLSLFEFLYTTLQGYDFLYLFENYGCVLQIGGDDQWANILDGIDLIGRVRGEQTYAMTFPLLLDSSGNKMGKTATGETIWLDPARTSPFTFYQYWLTTPDRELLRNFRLFTFLPEREIRRIRRRNPRDAQHRLAHEVTTIVHGRERADQARDDSHRAFGGEGLPENVPTVRVSLGRDGAGKPIVDVMVEASVVRSKAEARRLLEQGAVRVNDERTSDPFRSITEADWKDFGGQQAVVIRVGRGKVLRVLPA